MLLKSLNRYKVNVCSLLYEYMSVYIYIIYILYAYVCIQTSGTLAVRSIRSFISLMMYVLIYLLSDHIRILLLQPSGFCSEAGSSAAVTL